MKRHGRNRWAGVVFGRDARLSLYRNSDRVLETKVGFYGSGGHRWCEMKELQNPNVEHLLLHKNGKYPERKYDWENLFWSCSHCNGVKNNGKYGEGIICSFRFVDEILNRGENAWRLKR